MFGSQQPAPPFSGFGTPAASQPQASTSLFGTPTPATSQPLSLNLFGAAAKPPTSNFFSTPAPASAPTASTGLFGSAPPAQSAAGGFSFGGLSGAGAAAPKPPMFGASVPPSQAPQPGQQQPAGQLQAPITKRSKLSDLPDAARSAIEGIDAMIRTQIQVSEELKSRELGTEITETAAMYEQYLGESTAVGVMLAQDSRQVAELRAKLEIDLADLSKVTALIEGFKSPQTKGPAAKAVANFPFEYFSRKADEFKERITRYKATMDQIQTQVDSTNSNERNPAAIVPTLRAQHASFMSLASVVAALDNDLKALKDEYRRIWRDKTGSVQDPFARTGGAAGKIEAAVERMEIR